MIKNLIFQVFDNIYNIFRNWKKLPIRRSKWGIQIRSNKS